MQIILNGEPTELPDGSMLQDLINQLQLGERRLAVEVNREIIPRSGYADHKLQADDQIEIVHAIGGG